MARVEASSRVRQSVSGVSNVALLGMVVAAGGELLPAVEETWDLDPQQRCCPTCQSPYDALEGSADSELIEVEVRAHRRVLQDTHSSSAAAQERLAVLSTESSDALWVV